MASHLTYCMCVFVCAPVQFAVYVLICMLLFNLRGSSHYNNVFIRTIHMCLIKQVDRFVFKQQQSRVSVLVYYCVYVSEFQCERERKATCECSRNTALLHINNRGVPPQQD